MSDTVHLLTSDEPPVSLTVSTALLVSTCQVFAEILSLPAGSSDTGPPPIDLHEPAVVVQAFLDVLAGKRLDEEQLKEETVEGVARLSDKWDAAVVRRVLEGRIWELQALDIASLHAYTLSTYLDNPELLERTAARAVLVKDRANQPFRAAPEWKTRLDNWEARRKAVLFECVQQIDRCFAISGASSGLLSQHFECGESPCHEVGWTVVMQHFLSKSREMPMTAARLPITVNDMRPDLRQEDGGCRDLEALTVVLVQAMQKMWSKAPAFSDMW